MCLSFIFLASVITIRNLEASGEYSFTLYSSMRECPWYLMLTVPSNVPFQEIFVYPVGTVIVRIF